MRAEGCSPNVVTYNTLIDVYGKLGQWERALAVLGDMRREVGGTLLGGWRCGVRGPGACQRHLQMRHLQMRTRARGGVQRAAKNCEHGAGLLLAAPAPPMRPSSPPFTCCRSCPPLPAAQGVAPALRTFNTLVIACNACDRPYEALAVHAELVAAGFAPNSTTCNALVAAHARLGQVDRVLEVGGA